MDTNPIMGQDTNLVIPTRSCDGDKAIKYSLFSTPLSQTLITVDTIFEVREMASAWTTGDRAGEE